MELAPKSGQLRAAPNECIALQEAAEHEEQPEAHGSTVRAPPEGGSATGSQSLKSSCEMQRGDFVMSPNLPPPTSHPTNSPRKAKLARHLLRPRTLRGERGRMSCPFEKLGLPPSASKDDVKAAYRLLGILSTSPSKRLLGG